MNQAHLNLGEKKYETAINLYETILEKFKPNDLRTSMFLSKAYYRKGDFERSKDTLLTLLGLYPNNIPVKYNLALCLYQQADKLFSLETRKAAQTREAINYLRHSQKLFTWV